MNTQHDQRGRFARKGAMRSAAAGVRDQNGPGSTTGLRNALRRNAPDTKAGIAGRMMALPPSKRFAVKEKFLAEGPTAPMRSKLARALTAREGVLRAAGGSVNRRTPQHIDLAEGQRTNAQAMIKRAAGATEANRRAEKARVVNEAAATAERARVERVSAKQTARVGVLARANSGEIASPTGLGNMINRNRIIPGANNKRAIANRIQQLRGQKQTQVADKFIEHGPTTGLKAKLQRAEVRNLQTVRRDYATSRRAAANPASPPRTPPRGSADLGNATPGMRLRDKISRSTTPIHQTSTAVANLANNRSLPGTGHGDAQTRGKTAPQIKRRLADRIHALGSDAKRAPVIDAFNRHGLTNPTFAELRTQEGRRRAHLEGRSASQRAEAQAVAARQQAEIERRTAPKLAATRAKLAEHPHFAGVASTLNASNLPHIKELLSKVTPAEFHNHVAEGLPRGATVRYSLSGNTLTWNASGGGINSMTRNMDLANKSVYHAYFQVSSSQQGGDMGKRAFTGLFKLYDKIGIKKVGVTANIDVGGYAWAKYGFKPANEGVSRQIKSMVDNYLASPQHRSTSHPLSKTQKELLRTVSAELGQGKAEAMWKLVDHAEPIKLASGRIATSGGKPLTVGKAILLGKNWSGTIDLTDAKNKHRTHKYIGLIS